MNLPNQALPIQRALSGSSLKNRGIAPSQLGELAGVACNLCDAIFPPGRDRTDCQRTCRTTTQIGGRLLDTGLNLLPLLL
jgi:hypothetical protein